MEKKEETKTKKKKKQTMKVRERLQRKIRIITFFGNSEPEYKCIKWRIQTAINETACKRYAREDLKYENP